MYSICELLQTLQADENLEKVLLAAEDIPAEEVNELLSKVEEFKSDTVDNENISNSDPNSITAADYINEFAQSLLNDIAADTVASDLLNLDQLDIQNIEELFCSEHPLDDIITTPENNNKRKVEVLQHDIMNYCKYQKINDTESIPSSHLSTPFAEDNSQDQAEVVVNQSQVPVYVPTRRRRQFFSIEQRNSLEEEFNKNNYIPRRRQKELGQMLELSTQTVSIWFQNRRSKKNRPKSEPTTPLQKCSIELKQHAYVFFKGQYVPLASLPSSRREC